MSDEAHCDDAEHGLDPEDGDISIQQIAWGRGHRPRKSRFTITARKTRPSAA